MSVHTFNVRNAMGVRPITVDASNFPYVTLETVTGFDRRKVTHTSMVLGQTRDAFLGAMKLYGKGATAQSCFPLLHPADREFLISGTTPEEWERLFGSDEE
jgi:hypothetical protein